MKFIFYSISNSFEKYHRRNEIEALVNSSTEIEAIYFTPPKFIVQSVIDFFKNSEKQTKYYPKITICNLYIFIPKRWALRSEFLTFLFLTAPIKLQTLYAKKRHFSKSSNKNIISWFYKPDQYLYLKSSTPYIYLHYDNYKGDPSYSFSASNIFDRTLGDCIKNSLFTLVSSSKLYERYKSIGYNNLYYYPNAISRELIVSSFDKLINSKKNDCIIGFVGQVDSSFDINLVKKISTTLKNYEIRLVGGYTKEVSDTLGKYSNIQLLGYMPYELLGEEIKKFSVGICPYKKNSFNMFRNPLKITEYYSYGLPVVSVNCDIDNGAKALMGISDSDDGFIELLKTELRTNNRSKALMRRKYAEENCWDNRADFVINKVVKHLVKNV